MSIFKNPLSIKDLKTEEDERILAMNNLLKYQSEERKKQVEIFVGKKIRRVIGRARDLSLAKGSHQNLSSDIYKDESLMIGLIIKALLKPKSGKVEHVISADIIKKEIYFDNKNWSMNIDQDLKELSKIFFDSEDAIKINKIPINMYGTEVYRFYIRIDSLN